MSILTNKVVSNDDVGNNGILSVNLITDWINHVVYKYHRLSLKKSNASKLRMESIELNAPIFVNDKIFFCCKKVIDKTGNIIKVRVLRNNNIVVQSLYREIHQL